MFNLYQRLLNKKMEVKKKSKIQLTDHTIESNIQISPDTFVLSFKRTFEFRAGQSLKLSLDGSEPTRIYSIASGENDTNIDILYKLNPTGVLTPKMWKLKEGDKIYVSQPKGSFFIEDRKSIWISTGTGIAPFLSKFKTSPCENVRLIHGARHLNSFYFSDELLRSFDERYVRCCSKEISDGVYHGRLTSYIKSLEIQYDCDYYLCGNPDMVIEVRDYLLSKNVDYDCIKAEIYF